MIILDYSANTHKNSIELIKYTLDQVYYNIPIALRRDVVIKGQLFVSAGKNIPCAQAAFIYMYEYARKLGFKATASIFDERSFTFLRYFSVPFIKIANNEKLRNKFLPVLKGAGITPFVSIPIKEYAQLKPYEDCVTMGCVSEYPASITDYTKSLDTIKDRKFLHISDHTIGTEVYERYRPTIWEKHLKLEDSTGLDAGLFAITPEELGEALRRTHDLP